MKNPWFAGVDTEQGPRLDLASLIDMSFLMLVFFMVSATLQKQERDLALELPPEATSRMGVVRMDRMLVGINDQGKMSVNGEVLHTSAGQDDMRALADRLARYAEVALLSGSAPQVVIECADAAAEQRFIDALNACHRAGIEQISILE